MVANISDIFPVSSGSSPSGLIRGARFVYDASGTKTIATEWVPPSGYELDGWEVIAIGAGGGTKSVGPTNYPPGKGGKRVHRYIRRTDMATSATTVAIVVGAGVAGEAGGASSFGGGLCYAAGGVRGDQPSIVHPDLSDQIFTMPQSYSSIQEGDVNQGSPTGRSGGGGAQAIGGEVGVATVTKGPAAWPHPNAIQSQSLQGGNVFANLGNDNAAAGATGHDGVADGAGGGGNSCTATFYNGFYYDPGNGDPYGAYQPAYNVYSGSPGQGGFPGGGAGGSGNGATNTTQRGGDGRVIVYPYFRKTP